MFLWSYWRTIFADIKPIPDKYKLPETELEKLLSAETEDAQRTILENFAKDLPIVTRTILIEHIIVVFVLDVSSKMDHHCPWVNNCVCFHNYKFFMLFLGYALLYCLFIMSTCLPYFIRFWKTYQEYKQAHCDSLIDNGTYTKQCMELLSGDFGTSGSAGRYHIVFAFFVALMFAISLGSLFGYHCYLVAHNRTTLEAFRAPMFRGGADKNGFSIGAFNNFKEVFGASPDLWAVPVFTSLGDGCEYPVRREHQLQTFTTPQDGGGYESMGTTRSSVEVTQETERWRLCPRRGRTVPQIHSKNIMQHSFGDGFVYPQRTTDEDTESLLSSERWERWGQRSRPFDGSSSFDEL
ncbi:unnamed protein product [Danaus chrysippus]|uniref:Palmitoyltransferase n=1 Tax=Danaus chrysippus TaxID=151541 RepID=A0A8J2QSS3_9NEOP|nr:unnamed protein product [Danaus chrysippus]